MERLLRLIKSAVVLAVVLGLVAPRLAAEDLDLSYDIYSRDQELVVWVDFSPFIDGAAVSRLKDGIDVLLECRVSLSIPRRFFGDNLVARSSTARRLSYRGVTEEFLATEVQAPDQPTLSFVSLASLYQYFRDSIEIDLTSLDSLEAQERYVLSLDVTTISLTDLNLAPTDESSDDGESPLRFLFRQFLNLTEYGREEYSTKSRPFSLDEIGPEPQ